MTQTAPQNMIKQQLRTSGVTDERILALFESVPRAQFAPNAYAGFAYADMHIPLPHGQMMMTPAEEGILLQSLQLTGIEVVLEIGTGTGFLTSILSHLCQKVISIDIYPDFVEEAQRRIERYGCNNVELIIQNAYDGLVERAPFDCIILTGARPNITDTLRAQLTSNGRLFALIGEPPVMQARCYTAHDERFLFNTLLPPLVQLHLQSAFSF